MKKALLVVLLLLAFVMTSCNKDTDDEIEYFDENLKSTFVFYNFRFKEVRYNNTYFGAYYRMELIIDVKIKNNGTSTITVSNEINSLMSDYKFKIYKDNQIISSIDVFDFSASEIQCSESFISVDETISCKVHIPLSKDTGYEDYGVHELRFKELIIEIDIQKNYVSIVNEIED